METQTNDTLNNLWKSFEGKKIRIITKSNLHFDTSNLQAFDNHVVFNDRRGDRVMLANSELIQITEVKQ